MANKGESKTTIFVGGLDKDVTESILHAAFIPFGNIVSVQIAADPSTNAEEHKGYGFVEYELPEDCDAAIDNMHLAEINGRVIKVRKAKPQRVFAGSNRAIWSDDEWLRQHALPENEDATDAKSPPGPPPPEST